MRINENKENNENNKELSERFKRALKDLREIARNGLAQDTTVEAKAQTLKALIGRVLIIGKEEGLSHDFVSSQIQNTVGKDARDKIKNQTLIELLQTLVFPEYNKADPILPYHDEYIAFSVFNGIMKKYLSCTRKERRDIMRSDEEFHELVKERIAMHAGFKNSKECFGDRVKTLRVPKIPRGKELVWLAIGDPDPVMSEDDKKLCEVLSGMALVVVQAFKDLYPELYAESKLTDIMDNKKDEDGNPSVRLVLNTSHTEMYNEIKQKALSCDFRGMKDVALPVLIDGMIIRPLTEKKQDNDNNQQDYVNAEERQKIFDNILNTINSALENAVNNQSQHTID